jgi:YacP-like NYN domain
VSGEHVADVPDQALRPALEFAVGIAAAGVKLRPPVAFPPELKRFLRFHKLPPTALAQVRSAIEGDDDFRRRLASVATTELVDEAGMLWLSRPDGWEKTIAGLVPEQIVDGETAVRREERRRQAAQESAARARAELLSLAAELERERGAKAALVADVERQRAELGDLRQRLREAQRAEHATAQTLVKTESDLRQARQAPQHPDPLPVGPTLDAVALHRLVDGALSTAAESVRLLTEALREIEQEGEPDGLEPEVAAPRGQRGRRKAVRLPGGVLAGSAESAEFLLRSISANTFIDGYNVAKLGWPSLDLDHQREQCIVAAENLAKRWNVAMTIVFDGAAVEGAHAARRRRVRIVYSPAGVSADDVLREEVAASGPDRPVVVVTNDRAVITDVVAAGANSVSSDAFLALSRR